VQRKILEGLKIRERAQGARHLHRADELAVSQPPRGCNIRCPI
jgi:hypothetical protein